MTHQTRKWQAGKPPHNTVVEARSGRQIIRVRAIWGSADAGVLPHWESEDGNCLWSPGAFPKWREVSQ